jgi:hypothetical protein
MQERLTKYKRLMKFSTKKQSDQAIWSQLVLNKKRREVYSLDSTESAATTRNAMPVQKRSPPVRKYTTIATSIAGMSTKKSFMSIMIAKPMITSIIRKVKSKPPSPMLSSTEYTKAIRKTKKFIANPLENTLFQLGNMCLGT